MKSISTYKFTLILVLVLFGTLSAFSQKQDTVASGSFWKNWKVELNSGTMFFYGDIAENKVIPYPRDWSLGYGVSLTKFIAPNWGIRANFLNGNLSGQKKSTNSYFQTSVMEGSLQATYNVASLFWNPAIDYRYRLYGILGGGFVNYSAERFEEGTGNKLPNQTEDPLNTNGRTTEGNLSAGLGADFNLTDDLHLVVETSFFGLNSDNLDGYIGSTGKKDVFQYTSLGFGYTFDFKSDKPRTVNTKTDHSTSWKKLRAFEAMNTDKRESTEIVSQNLDESVAAKMVDVVCWIPSEIRDNEAFPITFEIIKKDLKGKAEIKIVLPDFYSAIEQDIPDAVFVPLNQNVTIKLNKLPETQEVPLQFKIKSNKAPAGNYTIYIMGKITDEQGKQYKFSTITTFKQLARN